MDSFCSLFDPSDGDIKPKDNYKKNVQNNVKKEGTKGRRRGRRANGSTVPLAEQSSFLCEPALCTDLRVEDGGYLESFIELPSKDGDSSKSESEKRTHKRIMYRKTRKTRTDKQTDETLNNNKATVTERVTIGTNVNDLFNNNDVDDGDKTHRFRRRDDDCKTESASSFEDKMSNSILGKLEYFNFKDDFCDMEEFSASDFDTDFHLDEDEDEYDEPSTEEDCPECYGSLPPEPRFGNVEYKLQLVNPSPKRFQHLVTQLKWRLISGGGTSLYVLGVCDDGSLLGLSRAGLRRSLKVLGGMASRCGAKLCRGGVLALPGGRWVAEVAVRQLPDTQQCTELRIAVMGANEAGKSTLIGVLTQGELDNGRGSARLNMFRHAHEVRSGRTSSLSHEILGFDTQGNVVNYGCSELMTAARIGSLCSRLVRFTDVAGHRRYQRTTWRGLATTRPHWSAVLISATQGITSVTEEHIDLLLALEVPFFAIITKCELAPGIESVVEQLTKILGKHKKLKIINNEAEAEECALSQNYDGKDKQNDNDVNDVALFRVSCVTGDGLSAVQRYLLYLPGPELAPGPDQEPCEFQIDELFHVDECVGPVVGGLLTRGQLCRGDTVLIGPLYSGDFVEITVKTIYRNRVPCDMVKAGQSASLGLSHFPTNLRQGMVLLAIPENYKENIERPTFGECTCKFNKTRSQKRKNDKNLIKFVEKNLVKDVDFEANIYKSDSEEVEERKPVNECVCRGIVYLDDPNDPRGCLYFQATIHLLRHSTEYIYPGFQCTVHIGNVSQTAVIQGILTGGRLRVGSEASIVFRWSTCAEYVRVGQTVLCRASHTTALGTLTQTFPLCH